MTNGITKTASDAVESIAAVFPSFGTSSLRTPEFENFVPALNELFNSLHICFLQRNDEDDEFPEMLSRACKTLNYIESVCSARDMNFHQALIHVFATGILLKRASARTPPETIDFFAAHLHRIDVAFADIVELLYEMKQKKAMDRKTRMVLNPSCNLLAADSRTPEKSLRDEIQKLLETGSNAPKNRSCRTFSIVDTEIVPAELASIREVDKFYGYQGARDFFKKYFHAFSEKAENLPLLITSLPGLGKTHFTISHALAYENLSLALGQPRYLQDDLVAILARLKKEPDKLFVLFFDDIDTRKIDWFNFRTNVGGAFILPKNVTIVIASNYEFPPNILSRGRGYSFPIFDEIRCQEMIHDFLLSLGMRTPAKELISVIAADYVEEFGQHVFEELSPRTLVRYLDRYMDDAEKRKRMLNLSKEKIVPIPDASCFLEANRKLIEKFCNEHF